MNTNKSSRFTHFDELLAVRMSNPEFTLNSSAFPQVECEITSRYIDDLLDLGFIFSHELIIANAVGKDENETARLIAYLNADDNAYALVTDLYHEDCWVNFTSFFPDGARFTTTSQPGVLALENLPGDNQTHHILNVGSTPIAGQWKRHKRLIATEVPDNEPVVLKPEQHIATEKKFYKGYVDDLLKQNILQQSDTQTIRFTRSGARTFHAALTSKSAKRPSPKMGEWLGRRRKASLKSIFNVKNLALTASAVVAVGCVFVLLQGRTIIAPLTSSVSDGTGGSTVQDNALTDVDSELALDTSGSSESDQSANATENEYSTESGSPVAVDRQRYLIADQEDEMWRIAVENAEFFLLSNDGDPAPWIRTARKISAGFHSNDSRLARTYFLSGLLESDYRIAEQQFNRALSIQTKTLGLYHTETAQTLEALAWIAEHNKEDLEEAITHQQLAINIYRDLFGPDAEDTKAAEWKLSYFEDRLAGVRPKADSNRRLLPALARFSR